MPHKCEAAFITCEDFRLHQRKDGRNYVAEFIKNLKIDCDLITRAGSIQDLVRPSEKGFCDCLLRDESVSAKLHEAGTIYLANHEDCGAYGDFKFSSREEELAQHLQDLHEAKNILAEEFPGKTVKLVFFDLIVGTHDEFKAREIE